MITTRSVVHVRGKGDFVVIEVRRIRSGRTAGYTELFLAPLGDLPGTKYAARGLVRPDGSAPWLAEAKRTYTAAEIDAAIQRTLATRESVEASKEGMAAEGRSALKGLEIGDVVTVAYTNGPVDEVVIDLNRRTGKFAVEARNKSGKRWLPATLVKAVKQQQRPLPVSLTDAERAKLDAEGRVQVLRGRELIQQSVVVSTTVAAARGGHNYDGASGVVYQDPATGLYHRSTGSHD